MLDSPRPLAAAALLFLLLGTGWLLTIGRNVLIPFALALVLWLLVNAIARQIGRLLGRSRYETRGLCLAVAILLLVMTLASVVRLIITNVGAVSAAAPDYEAQLMALLPALADQLGLTPPSFADLLGLIELDVWIRRIAAMMVTFTSNIGLIALYVGFLLLEQHMFDAKIDALCREPGRTARVRQVLGQFEQRVERYLWIKTIFSIAVALLSWCVLYAAGTANPAFWGLVVFLLNYIPVLGSFLGVLLPSLITLVQLASLGPTLLVAGSLAVIQFSLGTVLEPRLMGRTLNLSPVVIVLSLAAWGSLWGVVGMFLCVPIMVMLTIAFGQFAATRPLAILLTADGRLDPEPG